MSERAAAAGSVAPKEDRQLLRAQAQRSVRSELGSLCKGRCKSESPVAHKAPELCDCTMLRAALLRLANSPLNRHELYSLPMRTLKTEDAPVGVINY